MSRLRDRVHNLSRTGRVLFATALIGMFVGAFGMVRSLLIEHSTVVPTYGGTVTEGVIGSPRFINPILAESTTDLDLTRLTFSGLMTRDKTGTLIPDLARDYSISADGKTYVFTLKEGLLFHDNKRLTARDVAFTIAQTQVSSHQSPHREAWQGIKVTALDDYSIQFELPQAFAGFLDQTTLGIIPSHIWQTVPTEQFTFSAYNSEPVGSGPYEVHAIARDNAGVPDMYTLRSWRNSHHERPFVRTLRFRFYPTERDMIAAFDAGSIDTMAAISPDLLEERHYHVLVSSPLPRTFGMFFNDTRNPILGNAEIINAIELALDKDAIVDTVLHTFGTPLDGPLPPTLTTLDTTTTSTQDNVAEANALLNDLGWQRPDNDPNGIRQKDGASLQFNIATSDLPELTETANLIKQMLSKVGILVTINVFEIRNLELDIIQPRNFEALLFGQVVRHDTDLYAFWHSTQSATNGLNITNYDNEQVDTALETALGTLDTGLRRNLYRTVEEEITQDRPAIFLYAPHLVYVTKRPIGNFDIGMIREPSDRLNQAQDWYVHTERIWNFLLNS